MHAVQFCSLKTETERIQAQKDKLQAELHASRTELEGLRVALSHVQATNKALSNDKVSPAYFYHYMYVGMYVCIVTRFCIKEQACFLCQASLQQQCLELRSQVISLRSQVDTSQTVQRDFVQLSQSLQVVNSKRWWREWPNRWWWWLKFYLSSLSFR